MRHVPWTLLARLACAAALALAPRAHAADHLDTPSVIADPAADIGDLFAWTAVDGRHLNLVMDIVGRRFSDQVQYVFHVDSGAALGRTGASTRIVCQFEAAGSAQCWAAGQDRVRGDAGATQGLEGAQHRFRVFAGLRDDPYFNNVRGTRAALDVAASAVRQGKAPREASGFHRFDEATLRQVHDAWRHTSGGPAANFLAGWKTSAIVVSVDLDLVNAGGPLLAVWGTTEKRQPHADDGPSLPLPGAPIDRMGRALTGNMLVGTTAEEDIADQLKEAYNRADPAGWPAFATEIARNLALYDSFDGVRGNQWLADSRADAPEPYQRLALLLADDRLWVDSRQTACREYLAVERSAFSKPLADCGGRTPNENVNGVFRSLLIRGTPEGVDDGVDHDDRVHSTTEFPFLAAPAEPVATTDASVALANLDQLIGQGAQDPAVVDLLLTRMQFLADYSVLDRVAALTEAHARTADELLRRAHARAAAHRFGEALADLARASQMGASQEKVQSQRAAVLVAIGRADEALPWLRQRAARRPGFASHVGLAQACAAAGRYDEADALYGQALAELDTTLPFPAAAVWFARGLMWSEQAGDPARGAAMYEQALRKVPQYVAAALHLAELQAARGDAARAISGLEAVAQACGEPEALALLGTLHLQAGDPRGRDEIEQARARFEHLLQQHPQAFADHAAEFFLGAGRDPQRALAWAQVNRQVRGTPRAEALVARARGSLREAQASSLVRN